MCFSCAQICMVMNMDDEEWDELQKEEDAVEVANKLKPKERRRAKEI